MIIFESVYAKHSKYARSQPMRKNAHLRKVSWLSVPSFCSSLTGSTFPWYSQRVFLFLFTTIVIFCVVTGRKYSREGRKKKLAPTFVSFDLKCKIENARKLWTKRGNIMSLACLVFWRVKWMFVEMSLCSNTDLIWWNWRHNSRLYVCACKSGFVWYLLEHV